MAFRRVSPSDSALLICDIQEKFRPNIKYFSEITTITNRLLNAACILGLKVVATEQYPKGLGSTVEEIPLKEFNIPVVEKTRFSMCVPGVEALLAEKEFKSIILCGIEAHVCILQTALDFIEKGYTVHVVVDAVSSRSMTDRVFAFKQLERAGAILTTSECVILGLVGDSTHPEFRRVQKLIMESAPDTGLLQAHL